jgi:hypothetical protein
MGKMGKMPMAKKPMAVKPTAKKTIKVKGYTKVTKTGKVVKVKGYTRKVAVKKPAVKMAPKKGM